MEQLKSCFNYRRKQLMLKLKKNAIRLKINKVNDGQNILFIRSIRRDSGSSGERKSKRCLLHHKRNSRNQSTIGCHKIATGKLSLALTANWTVGLSTLRTFWADNKILQISNIQKYSWTRVIRYHSKK